MDFLTLFEKIKSFDFDLFKKQIDAFLVTIKQYMTHDNARMDRIELILEKLSEKHNIDLPKKPEQLNGVQNVERNH